MSNLGDYYFIKELLDRETALSHNEEAGYYSVSNSYFSSNFTFPESSYAYSFYNAMRAVFRSNYDYSNDSGFSNHETLHFFTFSGDDNLYYCFHNTPGIRGNTQKDEYYEVQFNPQLSTRNIYKYDTTTNEISVYSNMSSGGSYKSVPVYKFLASTGGLFPWGTNTNINYVNIEGNSGNSSGGWQVPNPNPTRKIVVNGSEPDDIKLNGATPKKIMLNGECYYEKAPEPDPHNYLYKWDFTKSLVDEKQGAEATYYGSNAASITRDSEGIHINNTNQCVYLCSGVELVGKTVEISISDYSPVHTPKTADSILCHCDDDRVKSIPYLYFNGAGEHRWVVYGYYDSSTNTGYNQTISSTLSPTDLDNSVIKFIFGDVKGVSVYLNDSLIGTADNLYFNANSAHVSINNLYLLGKTANSGANDWYNMTITGVRIYENEE